MALVIALIGILSTIAIRTFSSTLGNSRFTATNREMNNLVWAISGNPDMITASGRTDYGYIGDTGQLPPDLDALIYDPGVCGWEGPYISVNFGADSNQHKLDAWDEEYNFSNNNGRIQISSVNAGTKFLDDTTHLLYNTVQVQLYNSNGLPLNGATGEVSIEYGCTWNSLTFNESTGKFTSSNVPIGMHRVRGVGGDDTTYTYVGIVPSGDVSLEMTTYPSFGTIVSNGCGFISGDGNYIISEQVSNNGAPTFVIDRLQIFFFDGPCWGCEGAYLERIIVDEVTYWDYVSTGIRIGTGTIVVLDELLFIPNGVATIELYFNNSQAGTGGPVDMTATPMSMQLFPTNGSEQLIPFSGCGTGCGAPDLNYSPATATVSGTNKEVVSFSVDNVGDLTFDAISLNNLTWTAPSPGSCWECGIAYLSRVSSDGNIYWDYNTEGSGTRASSGNSLILRNTLDLLPGNTPIVMTFNNASSGTGAPVDMSIVDFDVPFTSSCTNFGPTQTVSFTASGGAASCSECNLNYVGIVVSGTPKSDEIQINMTNSGDDCEITAIRITSSLTTSNVQPWVKLIKYNGQNYWTYQSGGGIANTTTGLETTIYPSPSLVLTQADAIIDIIQFCNNTRKTINVNGATMTIQFTINCCDCQTTQEVSFTAN